MITKLITGQFLKGKKTYLAIILSGIGWVAARYGVRAESEELIHLLQLNWEEILQVAGLIAAIWARAVAKPAAPKSNG